MADPVVVDRGLTPAQVAEVAAGARLVLSPGARARMAEGARWYAAQGPDRAVRSKWAWLLEGEPTAGSADELVRRFLEGHCAGVGPALSREVVRATLAVRAATLAQGLSGCRPEVVDLLAAMLEHDVVPVVPSQGEVGAAGSVPLAHIARVACRYGGEAWREGARCTASEAMRGLPELVPTEKEALSLINGSSFATAVAALALHRAERVLRAAEASCALSLEVVRADLSALSPLALEARRHPGCAEVGRRLRELVDGSALVTARRRPDSFAIRCSPQVHGAARDALRTIGELMERELDAAVDNPLVFPGEGIVEAGNFHGAPVGLAMDHLKIALAQVASITERRIFRLTNARLSGLPSFLLPNTGVNSGWMLAQYTAASLVAECKALAHPASVDSIPTVQHHEDHVSMASVASTSAMRVVDRLADVVAIELLCAAQGLDFRIRGEAVDDEGRLIEVEPRQPGAGTRGVWERVRERVPRWTDDRVLHPDLKALGAAVREGVFS